MQENVFEAKTECSRPVRSVESKREESITVAKVGPQECTSVSRRIGVAKGKFDVPDDFDTENEAIASMLSEDDF